MDWIGCPACGCTRTVKAEIGGGEGHQAYIRFACVICETTWGNDVTLAASLKANLSPQGVGTLRSFTGSLRPLAAS